MKFNRHQPMPEAGFDITSMIDVVLLLTIFFMMSSQFSKVVQRSLDLPKEVGDAADKPIDAEVAVVVDLEKDGRLSVGGRVYELDRLAAVVAADHQKVAATGQVLDVVIRADRATATTHLSRLVSALSAEGVTEWRLATSGERASSGGER
ncbi:MAG: biopolymer transporter ExbD [Phycisphaerales bacterium]|nr:biopolymer transporter ExbD [Phycisphaerales bacterium]